MRVSYSQFSLCYNPIIALAFPSPSFPGTRSHISLAGLPPSFPHSHSSAPSSRQLASRTSKISSPPHAPCPSLHCTPPPPWRPSFPPLTPSRAAFPAPDFVISENWRDLVKGLVPPKHAPSTPSLSIWERDGTDGSGFLDGPCSQGGAWFPLRDGDGAYWFKEVGMVTGMVARDWKRRKRRKRRKKETTNTYFEVSRVPCYWHYAFPISKSRVWRARDD